MADLALADVTITINDNVIMGSRRMIECTIAFGDGAKTYPAGGVPLPPLTSFGLINHINSLIIDEDDKGYMFKYDKTNHKLRIFEQGIRTGSTVVGTSANGALAEGGVDGVTETAARLYGTAIDTTYQLGQFKELAATSTPAAVSAKGLAIGF